MNSRGCVDRSRADDGLATELLVHPWRGAKGVLGRLRVGNVFPIWLLAAVALAVVATASCGRKKAAAASAPPAPSAASAPRLPEPPSEPVSEPQTAATLPPPQPIPPDAVPEFVGPLAIDPSPRERMGPEPEPRKPPERAVQAGGPARRAEPSEAPPEVPQLGRILSPEDRRAYDQMIDQSLESARRDLALVVRRRLSADQSAAVRRIRAFIEQADDAREQDLALAKNLADRAQLLAADLARSIP